MPQVEEPTIEEREFEGGIHVEETSSAEPGSLQQRLQQRSKELEHTVSAVFPIPTLDDILAVELRLVGWEALRKIVQKHERQQVPAIRELYVAADQLLTGTIGFYELLEAGGENGAPRRRKADHTWQDLARATGKALPEDLTPRRALIALVGDTNVAILWQQWQEWMTTRRPEVDEEVAKDFGTTQ